MPKRRPILTPRQFRALRYWRRYGSVKDAAKACGWKYQLARWHINEGLKSLAKHGISFMDWMYCDELHEADGPRGAFAAGYRAGQRDAAMGLWNKGIEKSTVKYEMRGGKVKRTEQNEAHGKEQDENDAADAEATDGTEVMGETLPVECDSELDGDFD